MNFIHFNAISESSYPVGEDFNCNIPYIRLAATAITEYAEGSYNNNIALICRGTSGIIIASTVGYILSKRGFNVTLVVSRKNKEASHDSNMSGMGRAVKDKALLIVIDDFIDTGDTISKILEDINDSRRIYHYDEVQLILCVSNRITSNKLEEWRDNKRKRITELLDKFNVIMCNR